MPATDGPGPPCEVEIVPAEFLPRRPGDVGGTPQADTVGEILDGTTTEQPVDRVRRQCRRGERGRSGDVLAHAGRRGLPVVAERPSLAAAPDQHPSSAVGGHVAVELLGPHQRIVPQPVDAVGAVRIPLFDLPAGGGRVRRGGAAERRGARRPDRGHQQRRAGCDGGHGEQHGQGSGPPPDPRPLPVRSLDLAVPPHACSLRRESPDLAAPTIGPLRAALPPSVVKIVRIATRCVVRPPRTVKISSGTSTNVQDDPRHVR